MEEEVLLYKKQATESERRLGKLSGDIERLSNALQSKVRELEEYKKKLQSLELTKAQEINEMQLRLEENKQSRVLVIHLLVKNF